MSLKLNERYPGRFNNPSADYPQGSFKNRTTPSSKDGSYLEQDWANDKEGFFQSILSAAGLEASGVVDKVGASQFFDAIQKLKQTQSGTAFATTGPSAALVLTPDPAITAYAAGQRFRVKFNRNSTSADTINISGIGPKNLKQYDSVGTKVAAVFVVNQLSDVEYDGTDVVLIDQLPSQDASTVAKGIARFATPAEQVAGASSNVISNPAGVLALLTLMFPKRVFSANDFIRLPDVPGGFIIQFGVATALAGADTPVSFPTPFPGSLRGVFGHPSGNTNNTFLVCTTESESLSGFAFNVVSAGGRNAFPIFWLAIGN